MECAIAALRALAHLIFFAESPFYASFSYIFPIKNVPLLRETVFYNFAMRCRGMNT